MINKVLKETLLWENIKNKEPRNKIFIKVRLKKRRFSI